MAIPLPEPPLFRATEVESASLSVDEKSGSLSRGLRFTLEALRLAMRLPTLLAPVLLGTTAQGLAWCATFWVMIKYGLRESPMLEAMLLLFALYVTACMQGMVRAVLVDMVARDARGLRPALSAAAARLSAIVPAILGTAAIGTAFRFMARTRGSGVMLQAWSVGSFLVVPVLVLEDLPFSDTLTRARTLQGEDVLPVRLGTIAVSTVTQIVMGALLGPWFYFFYHAARQPMTWPQLVAWLISGALAWCLSNALTALAEGIYSASMYLWAIEMARHPQAEMVRVPDLLVPVLAMGRTEKKQAAE